MMMTDEKLLKIYQDACQDGTDHKQIVIKLADANECGVWEMATHLKEIGADIKLNQFSKFNPKRGGVKEDGGRIEYLKTIIKKQDEEIRRLADDKKNLSEQLETANASNIRLQQELNERARQINQMYSEMEQKEDRTHPSDLGLNDFINEFCCELHGVEAYLCGRIIESLYCWRYGNGLDPLRILPGLIGELIDMQLEKKEENI